LLCNAESLGHYDPKKPAVIRNWDIMPQLIKNRLQVPLKKAQKTGVIRIKRTDFPEKIQFLKFFAGLARILLCC
jgi:hypothetical protein